VESWPPAASPAQHDIAVERAVIHGGSQWPAPGWTGPSPAVNGSVHELTSFPQVYIYATYLVRPFSYSCCCRGGYFYQCGAVINKK